jgi:hypothetical protein
MLRFIDENNFITIIIGNFQRKYSVGILIETTNGKLPMENIPSVIY